MPRLRKRVLIDLTQEPITVGPQSIVQISDSDEEDIPGHTNVKKKLNAEIDRVQVLRKEFIKDRNSPEYERLKTLCPRMIPEYNRCYDELEKKCTNFINEFQEFKKNIDEPKYSHVMKHQLSSGHLIGTKIQELTKSLGDIHVKIQDVLKKG